MERFAFFAPVSVIPKFRNGCSSQLRQFYCSVPGETCDAEVFDLLESPDVVA